MQNISASLYAEWAGRLEFLLLQYDCSTMMVKSLPLVRFTISAVVLVRSWVWMGWAGLPTHASTIVSSSVATSVSSVTLALARYSKFRIC